jgi:DNA-binding beta-propeller fold protein YncE
MGEDVLTGKSDKSQNIFTRTLGGPNVLLLGTGGRCEMQIYMRKPLLACLTTLVLVYVAGVASLRGQTRQPLRLIQTISMPNVKGRLDHLYVDVRNKRLYVAGLENGSVEVVDLKLARWLRTMPGFQKPQGILFVSRLNKMFVASGDDGMVRVFSGRSFRLLDSIRLDRGANRIAYDSRKKYLCAGYGGKDAGQDYGEVAIISAVTDKVVATVRVDAHPAELLVGDSGQKLFALIPQRNEVQVIDLTSRSVIATWPVSSKSPGDAAMDETSRRLMIGTHTPPSMVVMDCRAGKEVASLPTVEGMDGVYYDAQRKRVYVSGGRGFDVGSVFVYQQAGADQYKSIAEIPTKAGAGTSFWSPGLNRYYVAAPAHNGEQASILVFQPQP